MVIIATIQTIKEEQQFIMPVFDFSNSKTEKKDPECTYTTFQSNEKVPSPEKPILIIDNKSRQWKHHSCGVFSNPNQKSSFEFKEQDGVFPADILKIDARFVSLVKWLGENHISVRLSGQNTEDGYAIYKIRETAFGGAGKLSAEDGFLQFMIERLLASNAPTELSDGEDVYKRQQRNGFIKNTASESDMGI